ncbi:hypothetical protein SEA_AOKA_47 [Arthrobacter phage Aoka]|nr:hypothetical protein SEA_AOKA_47 [Arthrobacter phage Aoka]
MIYQAQYEITDQDLPVSTLKPEAIQRFTEDVLQLGMVINGPVEDPTLIDFDGIPWLQIRAEVRDAGQLLGSVGARA